MLISTLNTNNQVAIASTLEPENLTSASTHNTQTQLVQAYTPDYTNEITITSSPSGVILQTQRSPPSSGLTSYTTMVGEATNLEYSPPDENLSNTTLKEEADKIDKMLEDYRNTASPPVHTTQTRTTNTSVSCLSLGSNKKINDETATSLQMPHYIPSGKELIWD